MARNDHKLLKSHLNIKQDGPEEQQAEEEELKALSRQVVEEEEYYSPQPEEPEPDSRVLKKSEISIRLSLLGKTAEGDGYTYLKAVCTNMGLTDIRAFLNFKHLHFIDVSNNQLKLENLQPLTRLPYLVYLQADSNLIKSAGLKKMKYLQVLVLNKNELTSVEDVFQPELSTLEVGNNKIEKIYFLNRMSTIRCLDFRYNMIRELGEMNFPNLDSLYLAGNKIKAINGIENLRNLRILHVRHNPIRTLSGFTDQHTKLQYINLRNCKIYGRQQIKKLQILPALDTIVLKGCPYMGGTGIQEPDEPEDEDEPELRIEVLATLPKLKRLNKNVYTPDERQEAIDLMKQWFQEGEKEDEPGPEEEFGEHQGEEELEA